MGGDLNLIKRFKLVFIVSRQRRTIYCYSGFAFSIMTSYLLHSSRSVVRTINHILYSSWLVVRTINLILHLVWSVVITINHLLHSPLPVFWTIRHVQSLITLATNCAMSEVQLSLAMSGLNSSCPPQRMLMYVLPENYILLGCYAARSGNLLPTFRDNLSLHPQRLRIQKSGTSLRNYHYSLRNNPEEQFSSTSSRRKPETTHVPPSLPLFPNKNATVCFYNFTVGCNVE
jgi:hypothetical protein